MRTLFLVTGALCWAATAVVVAAVIFWNAAEQRHRRRLRRELSDHHLARTLDEWAHL